MLCFNIQHIDILWLRYADLPDIVISSQEISIDPVVGGGLSNVYFYGTVYKAIAELDPSQF